MREENYGNSTANARNDRIVRYADFLLGVSRYPPIIQNFGNLQFAKHSEDLRPKLLNWMRYIIDNHNHLFEQPTLFYALIIYIFSPSMSIQFMSDLHGDMSV